MRASFRTFALLLALMVALVALPSVVMAAGGQSLSATMAAAFGAPVDLEGNYPKPTPGGTVPTPTPRPIPPAPVPTKVVYPTPTPYAPTSPTGTEAFEIIKVVGDRLSSTIYAYTSNGWLYRSDLDGRLWTLVVTNPLVEDFLMSAADPNVLYSGEGPNCASTVVTIAPMYKSIDGGYTWTELTAGLDLKPMLIDPANADNVFAADCATLYLSTDGGLTWSPKPANAADNLWQTYAPVALASGSLVGSPQPATPHWEQLFGVGNDLQNAGLVAFSGDLGDTWANITSATDSLSDVSALEASLYEGGKLWVVDSQGVWATADYGVNWTLLNQGLESLVRAGTSFNDVAYGQDGALYLATGAGLYVQYSPGAAWEKADADYGTYSGANMLSLLVTETNPRRLWVNAEDDDGDPLVFAIVID